MTQTAVNRISESQEELFSWLSSTGPAPFAVEPLPGDVSPRKYARVLRPGGRTEILASYPQEVRSVCARFLRTTELLEAAGVRVPRVIAARCEEGWMLLEDLGPETLGDRRGCPWNEVEGWFHRGVAAAGRIARLDPAALEGLNPALDGTLLRRELAQTRELFLEPRGLCDPAPLGDALAEVLEEVCRGLDAEPAVPCHRDFMARNLMPLPEGSLAVLDHQDLRFGPPCYDLASLLNDTLFPPAEAEEEILALALPGSAGPAPADRVRYHRAAAQRTLKAVGTYAAFARRGAELHLPLIAPTLSRAVEHLARLPEAGSLARDLRRAWAPALATPGA
jgi:N-acetylmuramate 1-kinase